jgi:hypothetical protein
MSLATIGVLDKDGNQQPVRVWDEAGDGTGPFQFVKQVAKADGTVINPATAEKQPALGTAGTPSADVLSVQGRSGMTPLKVEEPDGAQVSGSVTSAAVLFTQDMIGYESLSLQVTNPGSGCTTVYEASEDQTTWVAAPGVSQANLGSTIAASSTAGAAIMHFRRTARYFRARVSVYGSGTVAVQGTLSKSSLNNILSALCIFGINSHGGSVGNAPVRIAGRALSSNYTALSNSQTADLVTTLVGALVTKPYSIPESDWSYAAASGGISNTTTAVEIKAAAGSGLRNYITALQIDAEALTNATEVVIRDGAGGTVLWRCKIGTAGLLNGLNITFPSPIKGSANTLLEVATLTASGTGAVYVNAQGYVAP